MPKQQHFLLISISVDPACVEVIQALSSESGLSLLKIREKTTLTPRAANSAVSQLESVGLILTEQNKYVLNFPVFDNIYADFSQSTSVH